MTKYSHANLNIEEYFRNVFGSKSSIIRVQLLSRIIKPIVRLGHKIPTQAYFHGAGIYPGA